MAFNSFLFVFCFLPFVLVGYYALALTRLHRLRIPFLILATLLFYARGAPHFTPLLLASVVGNYVFGLAVARSRGWRARTFLTLGVVINVSLLLYFKYSNFFIVNLDGATGAHIPLLKLALPLAISFYTFQQIAYLVDVSRGAVAGRAPLKYLASILFFPSIISGPIVFYRELEPQLEARPAGADVGANLLTGLTLFSMGLFKKTVIADTLGLWVDPACDAIHAGAHLGAAASWGLAAAYLLQIYFDFSGYSDMATGLARMLGIRLPLNFHSPIRCTSIIDYWRRWHITLGRFVNLYIFQPVAIPLARWSAERGLGRGPALIVATLLPTFSTMLIIGAWHGGAWTYVVFGALHGLYMVANETFNFLTRKQRKGRDETAAMRAAGNILTMMAVMFAIVAFRSANLADAARWWSGMVGLGGAGPAWSGWPAMKPLGGLGLVLVAAPSALIAYLFPNSEQILTRIDPVLEWKKWRTISPPAISFAWRPTPAWAMATGLTLFIALAFIARGTTKFVYFNF
jgi:D-alanyl-lipoteichoic acid acyltransferase DltB (MBOAT superfamily)